MTLRPLATDEASHLNYRHSGTSLDFHFIPSSYASHSDLAWFHTFNTPVPILNHKSASRISNNKQPYEKNLLSMSNIVDWYPPRSRPKCHLFSAFHCGFPLLPFPLSFRLGTMRSMRRKYGQFASALQDYPLDTVCLPDVRKNVYNVAR